MSLLPCLSGLYYPCRDVYCLLLPFTSQPRARKKFSQACAKRCCHPETRQRVKGVHALFIFHISPLSSWGSGSLPKIHVLMWFYFFLLNVIWDSINIHQLMLSQLKLINSRVHFQHKIYFNSFVNYAMKSLRRLLTALVTVDCVME